jgi:glutathione S-transferase
VLAAVSDALSVPPEPMGKGGRAPLTADRPDQPENAAELARRWPLARFPLLIDGDAVVFETSAIIGYLAAFHPGPMPLIPADARKAVAAPMLDRVFDSHVMGPVQTIGFNARRPEEARDPYGVAQARTVSIRSDAECPNAVAATLEATRGLPDLLKARRKVLEVRRRWASSPQHAEFWR